MSYICSKIVSTVFQIVGKASRCLRKKMKSSRSVKLPGQVTVLFETPVPNNSVWSFD